MNQDQELWLRISHSGEVKEQVKLEDWRQAVRTIYESFVDHNGRKVQMVIEVSNQPLRESILTQDQQIEQQLNANAIDDPNLIMYPPDVTYGECVEAWESPEGKLMFMYQRAENRLGVEASFLQGIKNNYFTKFPRVAPHGPKWSTS